MDLSGKQVIPAWLIQKSQIYFLCLCLHPVPSLPPTFDLLQVKQLQGLLVFLVHEVSRVLSTFCTDSTSL